MKRFILILSALIFMSICGCGKQENQPVIIGAGDNGVDSAQNEKLTANSSAAKLDNTDDNKDDSIIKESVDVSSINKDAYLFGTWIGDNYIFAFYPEGKVTYTIKESNETKNAKFTTDYKTYIDIIFTNQTETITNDDGTTTINPLPDIIDHYEIQEFIISNNKLYADLSLKLGESILKLNRSDSIPSNSIDNMITDVPDLKELLIEEQPEVSTEPAEITAEQLELINQMALEQGIDPKTGLPLEELNTEIIDTEVN